jgi:DNA-binding transcriptional ArsR family regulator
MGTYEALKKPGVFSEELLRKTLCGISLQKYEETVTEAAKAFGVSPSSLSRHIIKTTAAQLKEFKERDLSDFKAFAVFIDTIHRAVNKRTPHLCEGSSGKWRMFILSLNLTKF